MATTESWMRLPGPAIKGPGSQAAQFLICFWEGGPQLARALPKTEPEAWNSRWGRAGVSAQGCGQMALG